MATENLPKGVLGFWSIVFLSVIAIFPGSIYIVSSTTALSFAGEAAPLTFVLGTALMFFNVIAVYIFSTKVVNAGGFYKFVQKGTNSPVISRAVAWDQFIAQMTPVIISSTVFGWLIPVTASTLFNVTLPTFIPFLASILVVIFVFLVSYFGIKLSAIIAMIVGIAQLIFITAAGIMIVSHSHYNTLGTFNIANSSGGLSGFFIGMVTGPLTAYIGYSAVVHFSEEAKFSKATMKKAIITSILVAGIFETFMMYAISVGVPKSGLAALAGTYAPALLVTAKFVGVGFALLVLIIALMGQITSPLTFGNAAERILYSLSRDNILPKSFSKIHPKYGSPSRASLAVLVFALAATLLTQIPMVLHYGVLTGFFYTVVVWATILTVTNLIYHFAVNQSLAFLMNRLKELNILKHIVGPTIGSIFIIIIFYYSFLGLPFPFILAGPIVVIWFLIGLFISYRMRKVPLKESDVEQTSQPPS
ncbi:MAG: APC family permease [Thermoplasmatales archaeon]|jgi:amino acid transporter|nr:APC family permease [Thermoplasmatales archaeon]